MEIKNKILKLTLLSAVLLSSTHSKAGIETQLNEMFGSMTNVTPPVVNVNATRRGVIGLGGITIKNKISNPRIVSFVPPSFKAGCGGIDMYGGSFSFISSAQFQQLLRNIASNAAGYAFQLALDAMCPNCMQHMAALQKKIQQFNQFFSNSCKLAQGIVNDTVASKINSEYEKFSTESVADGLGSLFDLGTGVQNPKDTAQSAGKIKPCTFNSNIIWCEMKRKNVSSWFTAGDDSLLEIIMALSGAVVIGPDTAAADGEGDSPEIINLNPNNIALKQLIEGGTITYDGCGNSDCTRFVTRTRNLIGFRKMFENMLLTNGGNIGIVDRYINNSGQLSQSQLNFITNLPHSVGAMIKNLTAVDGPGARSFAKEAIPTTAVAMLEVIINDFMQASSRAVAGNQSAFKKDQLDTLRESSSRIQGELSRLIQEYGSPIEIRRNYEAILRTARHKRYSLDLMDMSLNQPARRDGE